MSSIFDETPPKHTKDVVECRPPEDLLFSLISLYFSHIQPWFPVLNPRRVLAGLSELHCQADEPPSLYYAMAAISLPFSRDTRLDAAGTDGYWKYCKRRVMLEALEDPSFEAIQALLILTLDLSSMTNGPQVWGVLAVVVNLSLQLGLGDEPPPISNHTPNSTPPLSDWIDEESRRRVLWGIYMVDRCISMTTPHPCRMQESSVDRNLPCPELPWNTNAAQPSSSRRMRKLSNIDFANGGEFSMVEPYADHLSSQGLHSSISDTSAFANYVELLSLCAAVHDGHRRFCRMTSGEEPTSWHSSVQAMREVLMNWNRSLPPNHAIESLSHTAQRNEPATFLMHAHFNALLIHLQGPVAYPSYRSQLLSAPHGILDSCLSSVTFIVSLLEKASQAQIIEKVGWPFAWTLWTAARFQLVHEQREQLPISANFTILHNMLKHMSSFCQISGKYWRLLDMAVQCMKGVASTCRKTSQSPLSGSLVSNERFESVALIDVVPTPRSRNLVPDKSHGAILDLRRSAFYLENHFRAEPSIERNDIGTDESGEKPYGPPGKAITASDMSSETHQHEFMLPMQYGLGSMIGEGMGMEEPFEFAQEYVLDWTNTPLLPMSGYQQT